MRLTVHLNDALIADVICGREAIYVGRDESCRVVLDDPEIGGRQILVHPEGDGSWRLTPLHAGCAVQLNAQPVMEPMPLVDEDRITFREYLVSVFPSYEDRATPRVSLGTSQAQLERFAQTTLPLGSVVRKMDEPLTLPTTLLDDLGCASQRVSGTTTVESWMDGALQALLERFAAQRAWVGIRRTKSGPMEYEEGRLLTGQTADMPAICTRLIPRVLDRAQFVLVPRIGPEEPASALAGPLLGPDDKLGLAYVDSGESGRRFTRTDLDFFMAQLHLFAHQLDSILKTIARSRASMIDGQVTVAHEIQARLTPRKLPQWKSLQCAAFRETGRARTGDIYDVLRLSNNLAAFMIAQTSASGPMPSYLMTQAQAAFRISVMHQDTPAVFLRSLNWILYDGQKDHPLDCLAGVIDPATGKMSYALAGSMGAYLISATGEPRRLGPRDPAPAVSLSRSTVYPLLPEQLRPGETLALFTAGVTTARNPREETFGTQRVVDILCDGFGQNVSGLMSDLVTELRHFTEGGSQPEDVTVILAHRPGE